MEDFRHNLSPVEVKILLKTTKDLAENLFIRYCFKVAMQCPKCGNQEICLSGAVSFYSSSFDKVTHEIRVCLRCGYKNLTTLLTIEKL
jgi:predicted nucleic-acid-binding Zn-ribbon protein